MNLCGHHGLFLSHMIPFLRKTHKRSHLFQSTSILCCMSTTLLKSLSGKLGKDEAGLVDLRRVVSALGILLLLGPGSDGVLDVGFGVLGADHEADLTRGVGGDGGVGVLGDGEDGTAVLLETSDEGHVKPGALGCE